MKPAEPGDTQRPPAPPPDDADTAAEGIMTGAVKWFDATRGYGFVVPDAGGPDILIHHKLLTCHGCKHLPDGVRLKLRVVTGARGQQASQIVSIDSSVVDTAAPPPRPARAAHGPHINPLDYLDMAGDFEPVEVCWFNRARGYGFLLRGDGVTQIFVHMETVRRAHLATLVAGQCCRARVHDGPRGALAVALEALAD